MKIVVWVALLCLTGCSWFHHQPPPPPAPELIITGATAGSIALVDGIAAGQSIAGGKPLELLVTPGDHSIAISVADKIVYREDIYVAAGEQRVVKVLSGITHP